MCENIKVHTTRCYMKTKNILLLLLKMLSVIFEYGQETFVGEMIRPSGWKVSITYIVLL